MLNAKDDGTDAYTISNAARPLLSHGPKGSRGNRKTYLYVEALRHFEKEVSQLDLSDAYKKARPMYSGRLERTFIILKDDYNPDLEAVTGSNREPVGKRLNVGAKGVPPKRSSK